MLEKKNLFLTMGCQEITKTSLHHFQAIHDLQSLAESGFSIIPIYWDKTGNIYQRRGLPFNIVDFFGKTIQKLIW